ncbi:hypothetical protein CDV55_107479 [Aspergillus turcosus]|nr:hypothetical protein CDV55_107479 [Aspergillus turcosus]
MAFYRDPETEVAWDHRDLSPDSLNQIQYEEYERIKWIQVKHLDEENQLQTILPDSSGASECRVEMGLEDSLLVDESDLSGKMCANAIDRPGMWARMSEQGPR